jgi:dipeptidyl aminopeptidase/acylaminoacyl peptidase
MKLCLFLLTTALMAGDLATEVHNKGWVVFSAQTDKGDWDLFVMRPDGSQRRNITNTPDTNEIGGRYSPDGKRMLFRRIPKSVVVKHDRWGTLGQLTFANADGTGAAAYGVDGEYPWAVWGPDGKQIATLTKTGIEIWDVAAKKIARTLDRKGIYQQLFWSPDGKYFTGPANLYGENWTVIRLNAMTGEANAVNKFQNCTPDWFPDSKRVIFSSRPANQEDLDPTLREAVNQKPTYGWTQLWMANGEGTGQRMLYGEDGRHIYGGAISPDGLYVIFTRSPIDGITKSPMGIIRLADAPIIGGDSKALRKLHPKAHDGPVLNLPEGFEPHWTYTK